MFRIGPLQVHIGAAGAGCEDKRNGGGDDDYDAFAYLLDRSGEERAQQIGPDEQYREYGDDAAP